MNSEFTNARGLRGALGSIVPNWLSNRRDLNVGFKVLWIIALLGDVFVQVALEGLRAAWPGRGTATALAVVGRGRGIIRGYAESETDAHYAERLRAFRDAWLLAGSQDGIVTQAHEYLSQRPLVRIVSRAGVWTTIAEDGTITKNAAAWDWDSVSNPERAGYWSDEWVIVYPDAWSYRDDWGTGIWGADTLGLGHDVTRGEYGDLRSILATWKGAHSNVRTVIFTTNAALFDPDDPGSLPDGTWGQWGLPNGSGSRVAGGRITADCRYWDTTVTGV